MRLAWLTASDLDRSRALVRPTATRGLLRSWRSHAASTGRSEFLDRQCIVARALLCVGTPPTAPRSRAAPLITDCHVVWRGRRRARNQRAHVPGPPGAAIPPTPAPRVASATRRRAAHLPAAAPPAYAAHRPAPPTPVASRRRLRSRRSVGSRRARRRAATARRGAHAAGRVAPAGGEPGSGRRRTGHRSWFPAVRARTPPGPARPCRASPARSHHRGHQRTGVKRSRCCRSSATRSDGRVVRSFQE